MNTFFHVIAKLLRCSFTALVIAAISLNTLASPAQKLSSRDGLPTDFPSERIIIDAKQSPWNRIGNLSIAGRKFCSASLIADNVIITAAHCLWNHNTENWYPAEFIHFLAGYQQEDYVAHSRAKAIYPNPNYQFQISTNPELLKKDWALIELEEPLGALVGYFPLHILKKPQQRNLQKKHHPVALAGYRQDTREALSLDNSCELMETPAQLPSSLLSNNCHGLSGDSGGPLLIVQGQNWELLGIHAGRHIDSRQRTIALAIPSSDFYDQLLSLLSQTSLKR